MMKKMPGKLCLALLIIAGAANGLAQQRDPGSDPRNNPAQQQPAQPDPRGQQRQDAERANRGQAEGARQGRLSPARNGVSAPPGPGRFCGTAIGLRSSTTSPSFSGRP